MVDLVLSLTDDLSFHLLNCPQGVASVLRRDFHEVGTGRRTPRPGDLVISFVDLALEGAEQLVRGVGRIHHDRYFHLDRLGEPIELPFGPGSSGDHLEVSSRATGAYFVPNVLLPLVHMHLLRAGGTLVHAACVQLGDGGVLLPAWGGTGKTSTLIALLRRHDARYLGDDLVTVTSDGRARRLTRTINVLDYNLAVYGDLRPSFPVTARVAATARQALMGVSSISRRAFGADSIVAAISNRIAGDAKAIANAKLLAEVVGNQPHSREDRSPTTCAVTHVMALERGGTPAIGLTEMRLELAAGSMVAALEEEFNKFFEAYRCYRGMLGTRPSDEMDSFADRTRGNLSACLKDAQLTRLGMSEEWNDYDAVAAEIVRVVNSNEARPQA